MMFKKPTNALVIIEHTYMFRSPSATIFRAYSIKQYDKDVVYGESVQDLSL